MAKNEIKDWTANRRKLSNLKVEKIPLDCIRHWNFSEKEIVHKNNYYFSIIGVEVNHIQKRELSWDQPIILQKEIGELGFIVQNTKILLQAKTEPGNVNGTQIGPTVQATVSNYMKVHGGDETKFLNYFLKSDNSKYENLSDSIQLEQGTGFMNKSNRNSIVRLKSEHVLERLDDRFKWVEIKELFSLLEEDYLLNTDTRSVLVSCDWQKLTENYVAFSDNENNSIKKLLNMSYYDKTSKIKIFEKLKMIQDENKFIFNIKNLNTLRNWKFSKEIIIDNNQNDFAVKGFRVNTEDREVSYWEHPLVHLFDVGNVILYCQQKNGFLKFLLTAQIVIGGEETLVWGPSVQNTRGEPNFDYKKKNILAECMQSDEGGRFYQSKCLYQIIELEEDVRIPDSELSYWASLSEIQQIINQNNKTTNELRSVLSLLLKFL